MGKPALVILKNEIFKPLFQWKTLLADRDHCETDSRFLQIIPYIILHDVKSNTYFLYERGIGGGENRLHSKKSIGIGGHVDSIPLKCTLIELLAKEAVREILEEVGLIVEEHKIVNILTNDKFEDIYLPDSSNEVDHVHYGIAFVVDVDKDLVKSNEPNIITKCSWETKDYIKSLAEGKVEDSILENWSVEAFNKLLNKSVFN